MTYYAHAPRASATYHHKIEKQDEDVRNGEQCHVVAVTFLAASGGPRSANSYPAGHDAYTVAVMHDPGRYTVGP